jgi:hypothetical protein
VPCPHCNFLGNTAIHSQSASVVCHFSANARATRKELEPVDPRQRCHFGTGAPQRRGLVYTDGAIKNNINLYGTRGDLPGSHEHWALEDPHLARCNQRSHAV